ncbi:MAG: hypothetical protein AB1649_32115 [Chloroflexota bacterium]
MLKRWIAFVPVIFFVACGSQVGEINPPILTAVAQTQTAMLWTPTPVTPSATPEPDTANIVDVLNNAMIGVDPLAETIVARFSVIDVQVITEPTTSLSETLRIHIDCEWIYSDGCTLEESFVALIKALTRNEKTIEKITENVPQTVHTLQVVAFDRMMEEGMVVANWQDVLDYIDGRINGNQLGARIVRLAGP